jgi:hypothetical protein
MKPHTNKGLLTAGQKRRVLACCVALVLAASITNSALAQSVAVDTGSLAIGSEVRPAPVGEVSLVLGRAWIQSAGQPRTLIGPGTLVRATDRIQTESNGHVHIRFVDQALVSVRPDSLLEIVQYDFLADRPGNTSIKLNLEEGVTRSISGQGASSARERFRLNTPIAAIGVRGTDFVVSASPQSVRAAVNEGTIVMAPFSSECSVDTFGPCLANAIELTESSLQILEIQSAGGVPELLPATLERDPEMMRAELALALAAQEQVAPADEKTAGTEVFLENVTSMRVQQVVATAAPVAPPPVTPPAPVAPPQVVTPPVVVQPVVPPVTTEPPVTPPPVVVAPPPVVVAPPVTPPPVVVPVTPPDFTPVVPVPVPALTDRNLVWGRWGAGQGELEKLTMAYVDVRVGRDVTVGNDSYVLFRDGDGKTRVQEGLGPVSFSLHSAQAFYHSSTGVVAMTVKGGSLDINFNNNRFATELNMNHSLTGDVNFIAYGFIYVGGYFYTRSPTERMAGAVSLDGTEAGYYFEKQLEAGGIQGLTLWDKR